MDDIPASSIVVNDNGDPFRGIGPCIFDQFMNIGQPRSTAAAGSEEQI